MWKGIAPLLLLALTVGWISGAAGGGASASPPAQSRTLVSVTTGPSDSGPIFGFAQDGERLAWAAAGKGDCPPVQMRDLSMGRTTVIGHAGSENCDYYGFWIAAGGTRALWGGFEPANHPRGRIELGGLGRRPHDVGGLSSDYGQVGDFVVNFVGDGSTLVYATLFVVPNDWDACFPADSATEASCRFRVSRGAVKRIVGNQASAIPGVPPSAAIATSAGRIALAPADLAWGRELHARKNGPVEIRDAQTGSLSLRVTPRGEVEAVALSPAVLAALVRDGRTLRLEIYDTRTGALRSSARVGVKTAPEIAAAGTTVVYHENGRIGMLRAGESATSLVATAATAYPFDLSIEGHRVAWAENLDGGRKGRIQAVELP
jgi:hypothetical protein